jgi:hypothetical protein
MRRVGVTVSAVMPDVFSPEKRSLIMSKIRSSRKSIDRAASALSFEEIRHEGLATELSLIWEAGLRIPKDSLGSIRRRGFLEWQSEGVPETEIHLPAWPERRGVAEWFRKD